MAHTTITGNFNTCHSFLIAAKKDFMYQNIENGSLVYLSASIFGFNIMPSQNPKCTQAHEDLSVTADKPYECDKCQQVFPATRTFNRHKMIYTDVKPYDCGTCNKHSTRTWDVRKRQRIQTGVKHYECGKCHKQFTLKGNLMVH